jgi:outer membrane lipoprotein-sorting protein
MTELRRPMIKFLAGFGLPFAVLAGEKAEKKQPNAPLDAQAVMRRAEEALKQIKLVEYRFAQRGYGEGLDVPPKAEGRVVLSGYSNMWVKKFRLEAKVRRPGESEPVNLTAGSDGNVTYLVDEKTKKVYADMDPAVLGSQSWPIMETLVTQLVNPDSFEYEKKASKTELKEPSKVGEEECHTLRFEFGAGSGEVVWYFSQRDFLPRRVDWVFKGPKGEVMGTQMLLMDLRVNPAFDSDPFQWSVPEGFTRTDDFAP